MAGEKYDAGDQVLLQHSFYNVVTGALENPTGVQLTVRDPEGTETIYTYALAQVTKDSTGVYHYVLDVPVAGTWHHRWEGVPGRAEESSFFVRTAVA